MLVKKNRTLFVERFQSELATRHCWPCVADSGCNIVCKPPHQASRIARSGHYTWLGNRELISWRSWQRESIDTLTREAYINDKGRNGVALIVYDLAEQENPLDIKTIRKRFKRQGLIAKAANLLARDFSAQHPIKNE